MRTLIIIGIVLIVAITYVAFEKATVKREGEITVGDLIEESKSRLPGATINENNKIPSNSVTPAFYEGTHLVSVSESDQELIRFGGTKVSFNAYVLSKIPKGFALRPTSISSGVQNGVPIFQAIFSHKNGDNVFIYQYPLSEYLASGGMTLAEYTNGSEAVNANGKKVYISDSTVTTAKKYQFHQTVTVIDNTTLVRIEYTGEEKLSNADLTALASSLVR